MKSALSVCATLLLANHLAACSVYMEATRPTPVDLNEYQKGMTRDAVLEKLGAPENSATESDGTNCDFYKLFTRGYGAGGKIPIALAEGAADFFTLGLAEVVLTPTEGVTKNEKHTVTVCYKDQKLTRITGEGQPDVPAAAKPDPAVANSDIGSTARANPTSSPSSSVEPATVPSRAPASSTQQPSPPRSMEGNKEEN
jgi:outer membrane protein assembly factor BamE (lipoprotein component of BamABCDE complex)